MAFYFQDDFWETVSQLPDDDRDKAIASLVVYYFTGEEPSLEGVALMPFLAFKGRLDMSKKQSNNAKKPRKRTVPQETEEHLSEPNANQTLTKDYPNDNQTLQPSEESKSKSESKKETKKVKRFIPPTPEEVEEYSKQRGHPIDGQAFCDFYASKGWVVGRNPMKDWQAAVRTWISRGSSDGKRGGNASASVQGFIGELNF